MIYFIYLCIVAHNQVSELHNLIIDGGSVSLLDDIVRRSSFTLLNHNSRPHAACHHRVLLHARPCCVSAGGGDWRELFDGQLVCSSPHHNRNGGENVAAHQRLGTEISGGSAFKKTF